jgi:hypothetical protein
MVEVDSAATVADQLQIGGAALPADELFAVELQDQVEVPHIGATTLEPPGGVTQVVGAVDQVGLDTRVVEPLAGAAPVAAQGRLTPVGGFVGGIGCGTTRICVDFLIRGHLLGRRHWSGQRRPEQKSEQRRAEQRIQPLALNRHASCLSRFA